MKTLLNNKTLLIAMVLVIGIAFASFAEDALYIDADGNVGIGTTSLSRKLEVNGDVRVGRHIDCADDDAYGLVLNHCNSKNVCLVSGGGKVGINNLSPASKLHVNGGDIRVSGGSFIDDGTTLNVPDYVFKDEYNLMSLSELEKYINKENHLPNIPNSETIKENGLNISELQMKLLEKIEELTLYTLEQQAEIDVLKKGNNIQQKSLWDKITGIFK